MLASVNLASRWRGPDHAIGLPDGGGPSWAVVPRTSHPWLPFQMTYGNR